MNRYLISYDVTNSDYAALYRYIEKHNHVHLTELLYAIKSYKDQTAIRDDVANCIPGGSSLLLI